MKIAFRNFVQMLRRYKTASALNIAGLTLAFTAFYVIMTQVWWELGYNRSLPEPRRTYLVQTENWSEPGTWWSTVCRPYAEGAVAATPGVEIAGCMRGDTDDTECWKRNPATGGYEKFTAGYNLFSLSMLDLFEFRAAEGDLQALTRPRTVAVSRTMAGRMKLRIGDMVWMKIEEPAPDTGKEVVAIFEDFPGNSLLGSLEVLENIGDTDTSDSSQWSYQYFLRMRPGADISVFSREWERSCRARQQQERTTAEAAGEEHGDDSDIFRARLLPVAELYFSGVADVPGGKGSAATTYTLLGIAVLVVVIAFINFVNFFFALIPLRLRTVNTFKVFGAPTSSLRFSFVFEAVGLVAISLLAASYLAFALQDSEFASYISAPLALGENLFVVALVVVVAVVMTLAASLYPAWYITSFPPAMAVKGSFSGSRAGRRLRQLLLGVQFTISLALIIATCFIQLQHRYMMRYDMGFDKRNLIAAFNTRKSAASFDALRGKLLADTRITAVTGAAGRVVSTGGMSWGRKFKEKTIYFQSYVVEWDFLRAMGIPLTEGRDFLQSDAHGEKGVLIFNEAARREFGLTVGDRMTGFSENEPIVGFCADFNFRPLQYEIQPLALYVIPESDPRKGYLLPMTVYIRTTPEADVADVAGHVRRSIVQFDPSTVLGDIRVRTFDEDLGAEYDKEHRLTVIVGAFSLLAVVIALMGVFGIVLFEAQHRRREIAVRKVMGATTGEVLRMFNARYLRIVAICAVLVIPVCLWGLHRWLSAFAYRIPLSGWVFAAAFVLVAALTILTVTVCTWRTANENPAESVKSE